MAPSKTSCFFSWRAKIFSSTVPSVMNRTARTSRVCPIRWARWIACISQAGFHHGSRRNTWFAIWRFRPSPPAFREMRMIFRVGSVLKATSESFRAWMDMPPRNTTHAMPARFSRNSTSSSMPPNCEKTMALALASLASIFLSSSMSASILVLLWNSAALTFCMMFFFPILVAAEEAGGQGAPRSGALSVRAVEEVGALLPTRRCRAFSGDSTSRALAEEGLQGTHTSEDGADFPDEWPALRFGVTVEEAGALRLPAAFLSPSSPSSSISSGSSRSTTSLEKQTGHPTPPEGRAGASATYALMQSRWNGCPQEETLFCSSASSQMSSWHRPQTSTSLARVFEAPLGTLWLAAAPPWTIRYGWSTARLRDVRRSKMCA
mmetsp:Transcript_64155/g.167912  ORF Transcript_64155/g.167912 Transcript_64155/m.167912 type:complete len:377 (-) Transcript_64155:724-1854(-)